MSFEAPECTYCRQMYSRFNEPIFIVCLCDQVAKYAHGSCFRGYLQDYGYGVCETCFTKTRIVPDGYKPFSEWKIKWKPLCGFWRRFKTDNRYWKAVYCRESTSIKRNKSIRRNEDVPQTIPWKLNAVAETESNVDEHEIAFEIPGVQETPVKKPAEGGIENESESSPPDGGISYPTVFKPRGYPFVKRKEDNLSPNSEVPFEYYHTLNSSNRSSFNSVGQHNYFIDSNSIYTVTTETNESISDMGESSGADDYSSTTGYDPRNEHNMTNESKFRTIGRQFLKRFHSEKMAADKAANSKKRGPSNNNTMQQVYTITELHNDERDDEIAVVPLENDIIFMNGNADDQTSRDTDDYWGMDHHQNNDDVMSRQPPSSKGGRKTSSAKNKKANNIDNTNQDTNKKLYGMSSNMFKPVVQKQQTPEPNSALHNNRQASNLSAPYESTQHGQNRQSTGLVNAEGKLKNIFYAPSNE